MTAWLDFSETIGHLNTKNILLEGDSGFAIKLIVSLCKQTNQFHHPILYDILYWIYCDQFCANHVYKETNKGAHFVVKCALHDK